MARRELHRLNASQVDSILKAGVPGRFSDGGGLSLVLSADGRQRWVFRFTIRGKTQDLGLGRAAHSKRKRDDTRIGAISLDRARELAADARILITAGKNPLTEKATAKEAEKKIPTFGEAVASHIASHAVGWKNPKHKQQWANTLADHAKLLTDKPVDQIGVAEVIEVLKPIWQKIPETASRVRGRIEAVLDAAKVAGHRTGENPAAWKGNLKHLLPARKKLTRGHFKALPFEEVPAFIAALRARPGMSARQLEFVILNASRSTEVRMATWGEVDFKEKLWIVPAERMKMQREHRVPLTARSIEILDSIKAAQKLEAAEAGRAWNANGYIFARQGETAAPSINATEMLLRRMDADCTTHGFRSSFRDWVGDATNFARELAEMQLAHQVGDETEAAYRRGDALRKRRAMMENWLQFCNGKTGAVVPLSRTTPAGQSA